MGKVDVNSSPKPTIANRQQTMLRFYLVACSLVLALGLGRASAMAADPNGRIVGGVAAAADSAPYAVSMQYQGTHYCAASILNANWLVTAAHCLTSSAQVLGSTLVAGSIAVAGTASTTQTRSITYFVVNDLYTGGTVPYDIGLVYTPTAFTWTAAVAPVTLPTSGTVPTGTATLYGWGSTSTTNTASYPATLQVANNLPIISLSSCESALGTKGSDVHSTNLCTGPLTGGVSICTSDSGGPLVQGNVLIGIVSWGALPCGQANSPSVYVQVSSFISWISSNQVVA
ncbi:trypsin delta [Drosophila madeirensis]|uniref:Trypsin delta n=1 Tax=Drosophila madeirensis TaxID=30013 RepID=A0AAU9FIL8_DROMD